MSISLCMIVKDESEILESFLTHHKPLYDELIVVDTGSSDNTLEIAKRHTDKVYSFLWNDDFSAVRNFSIGQTVNSCITVTKDWK